VWGYAGRNIHFGLREHAMAAALTGMALHGGLVPVESAKALLANRKRDSRRGLPG
jgi:transketolase